MVKKKKLAWANWHLNNLAHLLALPVPAVYHLVNYCTSWTLLPQE